MGTELTTAEGINLKTTHEQTSQSSIQSWKSHQVTEKVKQDDRDPNDRNGLDLFFYIPMGSLGTEEKNTYIHIYVYIVICIYMYVCIHKHIYVYTYI